MRQSIASLMLIAFGIGASGCAVATPQPSVYAYPARGQSAAQASRDQTECQAWAQHQTGFDPLQDTAKGLGIGAALGALTGAAAGAAIGAAAGGLGGAGLGGTIGYQRNKQGYDRAYAVCMESRGYAVR
jgi:hypothetical protein